jgi:hypothetical protein
VDISEAVAPQNRHDGTGNGITTEQLGSDSLKPPETLIAVSAHTQRLRRVIFQDLRRYADGLTNLHHTQQFVGPRRQHLLKSHRYAGFLKPNIYNIVAIASGDTVDQRQNQVLLQGADNLPMAKPVQRPLSHTAGLRMQAQQKVPVFCMRLQTLANAGQA